MLLRRIPRGSLEHECRILRSPFGRSREYSESVGAQLRGHRFKAISEKYDLAPRLYMIYGRRDPYNFETLRRVYGELIKSLQPTKR